MNILRTYKRCTRLQKISLWSCFTVFLYALLGFLVAPPLIKSVLSKKLTETLHRPVSMEHIAINPFSLTATVDNCIVQKQKGTGAFVSFHQLFVNVQLSSLFRQALVVQSCRLTAPSITVSRLDQKRFSFTDLITTTRAKKEAPKGQEAHHPFLFSINNIEITNGGFVFNDRVTNQVHTVSELNLAIPSISNHPAEVNTHVTPTFSMIMDGAQVNLLGTTKPFTFSRESEFNLKLTDFDIRTIVPYIPNPTDMRLTSGHLDIDMRFRYQEAAGEHTLLLNGRTAFTQLTCSDTERNEFATLPLIEINFNDANLFAHRIAVESILVRKPTVQIVRQPDGRIYPLTLFEPQATKHAPQKEPNPTDEKNAPIIDLKSVLVDAAQLSFHDAKNPFDTTLNPVRIELNNVSTNPGERLDFSLTAASSYDEILSLKGQAITAPLSIQGETELKDLALSAYMPYLSDFILPEISSGRLAGSCRFTLSQDTDNQVFSLDSLTLDLSDFSLSQDETKLIDIPELSLADSALNTDSGIVRLGSLSSRDAVIALKRQRNGVFNLAHMVKKSSQKNQETKVEKRPSTEQKKPWNILLGEGHFSHYTITLNDQLPSQPFHSDVVVDHLDFHDLATTTDHNGTYAFGLRIDETSSIDATGSLKLTPLATQLQLSSNLALPMIQNYVADYTTIFITDGRLTSTGTFKFDTNDTTTTSFDGDLAIDSLKIVDHDNEPLLHWDSLTSANTHYSSFPPRLSVESVTWKNPFMRLAVLPDGSLNLNHLMQEKTPANEAHVNPTSLQDPGENDPDDETMLTTVKKVEVQNGTLKFEDHNISPAYAATLNQFSGTVEGLSSQADSQADLTFTGKVNDHAPVTLKGFINPLQENLFADLTFMADDVDLSPTTPYTSKYIAYKTDKGKLNLNLKYIINNKKVTAQNKIFLDQFTLGEYVDSPDAVSLPIQLAIALLKNRRGEITLNIPVEGRLDDPEFSVGGVVFQVLFNLIAKAATSPFALLGALIPDGEDLQHVPFTEGEATLSPAAEKKLVQMASVLYDRPGLRMDIQGSVHPTSDELALKRQTLQKRVALAKRTSLGKNQKQTDQNPTDELTPEEYTHYLTLLYQKSLQEKKQALKDNTADAADQEPPTPAFMEGQLLKETTVTNEQLRLLAVQRATNVRNFLAENGPVESERLFLVEPKAIQEGTDSTSQVSLTIK